MQCVAVDKSQSQRIIHVTIVEATTCAAMTHTTGQLRMSQLAAKKGTLQEQVYQTYLEGCRLEDDLFKFTYISAVVFVRNENISSYETKYSYFAEDHEDLEMSCCAFQLEAPYNEQHQTIHSQMHMTELKENAATGKLTTTGGLKFARARQDRRVPLDIWAACGVQEADCLAPFTSQSTAEAAQQDSLDIHPPQASKELAWQNPQLWFGGIAAHLQNQLACHESS